MMGANSSIEWTHHTFNPWWGCIKVSPGCENCYALSLSKRWGYDIWGPAKTTQRRMMSDAYWRQPLKWNKDAERAGERRRVFCASMADVFEANPQLTEAKGRLFDLIEQTPMLDWLLLTKRPENIMGMIPYAWHSEPRQNVWYGTSVENQGQANKRIPELLNVPAKVRFLSCEPLLGPLDLGSKLRPYTFQDFETRFKGTVNYVQHHWINYLSSGIHWVIVGGESGHGARPMHPEWARSLRDQCVGAGVAFFMKQWGEHAALDQVEYVEPSDYDRKTYHFSDTAFSGTTVHRLGKHAAGRLLDGRTWDGLPS